MQPTTLDRQFVGGGVKRRKKTRAELIRDELNKKKRKRK